jgi:hypothetical protein
VLGGLSWLASNLVYGALVGLGAFALTQVGLTLFAVRRSAARRGPFAEPEPEARNAASPQTHPGDVAQLRTKLADVEHERDEFKAENEVLAKELAAAQTQPRPEPQPASIDEPFSLELVKRRGPPKPNGEFDISTCIRVTNETSGAIRGCRGRLVRVQNFIGTPDGHEWQDISHIHPAYLRWSLGDGGEASADFTTEATLDVAVIESWAEPVYQLLTADESLRPAYRLEYEPAPRLTLEIAAESGGCIELSFSLMGTHRGLLEAPTEVEPVVEWLTWP